MMWKLILFLGFFSLIFGSVKEVRAADGNQFINIVNPIRISKYNNDSVGSLNTQYSIIKKRDLAATWLITWDVLMQEDLVSILKSMDSKQELGLFMEVSPAFADGSGVKFNQTDSWHRANSLFLNGYPQNERNKMIDELFKLFKANFGYYPVSVGGWWVDSYSLEYMQNKYGIKANLGLADQFSTDGYKVWGTYYSVPYYPSKLHLGIPADDSKEKINVVNLEWAPRDPINGYGEGGMSRYSTQDYSTIGLQDTYFEALINLYAKAHNNLFGQITVGLEGDLPPSVYDFFAKQMDIVKSSGLNNVQVVTMKDFANWYQLNFPNLSPPSQIISQDLLGEGKNGLWYQSPFYRIGFLYDNSSKELKIIDLRVYQKNFQDPFYVTPNKNIDLLIDIPSVIDGVNNPSSVVNLKTKSVEFKGNHTHTTLKLDNQSIELYPDRIDFAYISNELSPLLNNPYLSRGEFAHGITIVPKNSFPYPKYGLLLKDLSINATFYLNRPKVRLGVIVFLILLVGLLILILKFISEKNYLIILFLFFVMCLTSYLILNFSVTQKYYVSQSEIDGLIKLQSLPPGKILIKNSGCLVCSYTTNYPPAVFGNKKDYISKISRHPVVPDNLILDSEDRGFIKEQVKRLEISFIYLVRYENYKEQLKLSPGDYNADKIYENANVQIWKVN